MGNDSCVMDGRRDHRSVVAVNDGDNYHSHYEGVSSREEGHDNHDKHHPWEGMDRHVHHEVAIEIVDGDILERKARQVEAMKVSQIIFVFGRKIKRTSATQRTVDPLKSSPSSFSVAVFKSPAFSNSTKLSDGQVVGIPSSLIVNVPSSVPIARDL